MIPCICGRGLLPRRCVCQAFYRAPCLSQHEHFNPLKEHLNLLDEQGQATLPMAHPSPGHETYTGGDYCGLC